MPLSTALNLRRTVSLTLSEAAVVLRARLSLVQPRDDARVAEPVSARRLVRVALARQTDRALILGVQAALELIVVAALEVVTGFRLGRRLCSHGVN